MERVRLTKEERRVLRWLQRNDGSKLKQIENLLSLLLCVRLNKRAWFVAFGRRRSGLLMPPSLKAAKLIFSLIHVCKTL